MKNYIDARPNQKQEAALMGRPAYDIPTTIGGEHIDCMGAGSLSTSLRAAKRRASQIHLRLGGCGA